MVVSSRSRLALPELNGRWGLIGEEAGLRNELRSLSDRGPKEQALEIDFAAIDRIDTTLADQLLERPDEVLKAGVSGLREITALDPERLGALRLRITGLPPTARRSIREIRETDLGHFLALEGIVRKVTEVRPQVREAAFQCVACQQTTMELQEPDALQFREPLECREENGGCGRTQGQTRFKFLANRSVYVDSQRIELQENPESLRRGAHPQGIPILLSEDLTGRVTPGNRLVINGIVKSAVRTTGSGRGGLVRNTVSDLLVLANSIESKQVEFDEIHVSEEEERLVLAFREDPSVIDKIVLSLAPTIKGMEDEKEAIALQLFGGVEKRHADGIRTRGDMHVLLVGDPGTGKSQLLRYVAEVAPRGIYTSGKGATAAGLTAAAVKDDFAGGRWVLEAGMLVLADGGMAVVDELDKMTDEDRSAMHEALEQQTVSISKAGITATLNARCPVLAAANPRWGRFDDERGVADQINLPATLLSRFDVIYSIRDRPNQERDRMLASQILESHRDADPEGRPSAGPTPGASNAPFPPEFLKKYIAYARRNFRPRLTAGAQQVFVDYYVGVRRVGEDPNAPVPITARQLEALVRMSEAAARARLSNEVSEADAKRATRIMESFLDRVSTAGGKRDIDLIDTGRPRGEMRREVRLVDLMRQLEAKSPNGTFTSDELIAEAKDSDLTAERIVGIVRRMHQQGELLEPRPGKGYKLTR